MVGMEDEQKKPKTFRRTLQILALGVVFYFFVIPLIPSFRQAVDERHGVEHAHEEALEARFRRGFLKLVEHDQAFLLDVLNQLVEAITVPCTVDDDARNFFLETF
jgi:hypothetical protein